SWWGGRGVGTVPHGLIAAYGGDTVAAATKFADHFAGEMNVTVLVDFENDSVRTALEVAGALGDRLWGVRLDTSEALVDKALEGTDHIGVAVEDLDAAIALYGGRLGLELVHRETVESQGVEAVLLDVGENHVELLLPLDPDTPVGKFLAKRGPGLHHVAYQTTDIEGTLEALRAAGMRLIDEQPRTGIRGSRVAFLHPGSSGGVLTEIV